MPISNRNIKWLLGELKTLVQNGVISEDDSIRIRGYYEQNPGRSHAKTLLGIIGSSLIGLGVILLVAHNWDEFSRLQRTAISFIPLLSGQAILGYAVFKKKESAPWLEGASIYLAAGIGASIGLISQIYHISTDFDFYILAWALLTLPSVYLARSAMTAAFYMTIMTVWSFSSDTYDNRAFMFLPLFALVLPYLIPVIRRNITGMKSQFLMWVLSITLFLGILPSVGGMSEQVGIVIYPALFTLYYLADRKLLQNEPIIRRPLFIVGISGIVIISAIFTFKESWMFTASGTDDLYDAIYCNLTALLFSIASAVFLILELSRKRTDILIISCPFILSVIFYLAISAGVSEYIPMITFNIYLLCLGSYTLWRGFSKNSQLAVNAGLAVLSWLATIRFFDSDISYTVRGVLFIIIGASFILINLLIKKKEGRS